MPRKRKPSTHPAYGEAVLQLSGYSAPKTWEDILVAVFPRNTTRQILARVILREAKEAAKNHETLTTSDWPLLVAKALKEDPVYSELGEFVEKRWLELEREGVPRPAQVKILTRESNEMQQRLIPNKDVPPGFGRYRGALYIVLRILAKHGMIRLNGTAIELDTRFAAKLKKIAELWNEFVTDQKEVW